MPDEVKRGRTTPAVHIDADKVEVVSTTEVPEGHVVVEPPTAATPAVTMPETTARAIETAEQVETSLRTEGQRSTSWLFETTQKNLALLMIGGFMVAHTFVVVVLGIVLFRQLSKISVDVAALTAVVAILTGSLGAIASLASIVASSYFQRTNSHAVGGVGKGYEGR